MSVVASGRPHFLSKRGRTIVIRQSFDGIRVHDALEFRDRRRIPDQIHDRMYTPVAVPQKDRTPDVKLDLLQGTLDIMVLQTLDVLGPLHGFGIARRIEQLSGHEFLLNQGTIYASLVRLQQRGWIHATWGVSDSNRRAKFYSLTTPGRRRIKKVLTQWERQMTVMARVLAIGGQP